MMQLDEAILREHYAHLVDRPFFPFILDSQFEATPSNIFLKRASERMSFLLHERT